MSGGRFNYQEITTADEFDGVWRDEEINELFSDLFVRGFGHQDQGLVKSLDLYLSNDIGEEAYREQVAAFKRKWFGRTPEQRVEFYQGKLQKRCAELKAELAAGATS
ncbi:MAG: hypothetical protein HFJ75_07630 [Eggerthellaceae bacterium]|nr:hypothetical protein [Eggerthellaceae bacterium]